MAFFWHRLHLGRSIPHFRLAPTQAAQDLRLDLVSVVFIIQKKYGKLGTACGVAEVGGGVSNKDQGTIDDLT
jgi:hypothetical protein